MKEIKQGGDGIVTLSQNLQYMLPNGTVGNTGKGLHFPSINNQSLVPTYFTEDNECYNIYVARCGDGIVDNGTETSSSNINASLKGNEQCDL
ncbi:MAG: hypothetical protein LBP53_04580 [Candidatus Peribacteria bacterium]|nr:hypothetical protein [Candidatus Peribacteria bacterium]